MMKTKNESSNDAAPASEKPEVGASSAPAVPRELLHALQAEAHTKAPLDAQEALGKVAADGADNDTAEPDDGLGDPDTDHAVDDIVAKEGDELLAAEDARNEGLVVHPHSAGQKIRRFFRAWWANRWARWITILLLVAALVTAVALPVSRYAVLNTFGVRSRLSVKVIDSGTGLPLRNVTVDLDGAHIATDSRGMAGLEHLKLGPHVLSIRRIAFASQSKRVVIGWGSNPLGTIALQAVGTRYTIVATDYLSGQPLANVEAATDDGLTALADQKGKITLTLDNKDAKAVPITVRLAGYRTEQLNLPAANTLTTTVPLVTDRPAVFVSKQSGTFDLYKMDIDGKNRQVLLKGTGLEEPAMSVVVSPDGTEAAWVSTRDNQHDSEGYLLRTLTLVDVASGHATTVEHAQSLQLLGWVDHRLLYREIVAGTSAANSQRDRLISYDYTTVSRFQLATANAFTSAQVIGGAMYYAVSATDPDAKPSFAKVKPDGTGRQTITAQEIWSVVRVNYSTIVLQTPSGWLQYGLTSGQLTAADQPGGGDRRYLDAPDGQHSLWTELRDGKGALLSYAVVGGSDVEVQKQAGLGFPFRWVTNSAVIYRVADRTQTADYVVSALGGAPHKLADVTATTGFGQ